MKYWTVRAPVAQGKRMDSKARREGRIEIINGLDDFLDNLTRTSATMLWISFVSQIFDCLILVIGKAAFERANGASSV
jgi:hypothetical protein